MIPALIITAYLIVALITARRVAWGMADAEGGCHDADDRFFFAMAGLGAGAFWPITLLAIAFSRWIWSPKERS